MSKHVVWVALWHNLDTGVWNDQGNVVEAITLMGAKSTRKQAKLMCQQHEQPQDVPREWWGWDEDVSWAEDDTAFIERCCDRGYYSLHRCKL
jgi:hypothetical protein